MSDSPVNILIIQCDQLAASFLSPYGNTVVDSPNIDRLAEQSVVFESAYSNFPLCAPSRFSMLSGRLASAVGAYDNGAEFVSSTPTFAHYLRDKGYQTCLTGKMHFVGADQLHGFEERLTTDIYPSDFNWTGDWTEASMEQSNNDSTFTDAGICLRNVQMEYDEEVCHRAVRKIYDLARGKNSRPFMLTVSMTHPHDPYQCTRYQWDRYRHEEIDMPRIGRIDESQMDPYSKRLQIQYGLHKFEPSEEQIRTARHAYYGSISYLDDQVGKILDTLRLTGLDSNTAIVFTSDHGDMLGERGLWYKKCFYEGSVRIPFTIRVPGIGPRRVNENVSLVDLLPTLIELATSSDPRDVLVTHQDGASLVGLMNGDAPDWDNAVYGESLAEGAAAANLMVKKDKLKYTVSGLDPEQLFDLEADPDEMNNLTGDTKYSESLAELSGLAHAKWNIDELSRLVSESQVQRMFVRKTLKTGKVTPWDFSAPDQVADHCLRGEKKYNDWAYGSPIGLTKPGET
jgi:choline-sulfatase